MFSYKDEVIYRLTCTDCERVTNASMNTVTEKLLSECECGQYRKVVDKANAPFFFNQEMVSQMPVQKVRVYINR